uniref:Histone H4 n=1 Tax=Angiostrongylus cantonensis TaxID=6313 RepID=A0A0K0DPP8_ANGCA
MICLDHQHHNGKLVDRDVAKRSGQSGSKLGTGRGGNILKRPKRNTGKKTSKNILGSTENRYLRFGRNSCEFHMDIAVTVTWKEC